MRSKKRCKNGMRINDGILSTKKEINKLKKQIDKGINILFNIKRIKDLGQSFSYKKLKDLEQTFQLKLIKE